MLPSPKVSVACLAVTKSKVRRSGPTRCPTSSPESFTRKSPTGLVQTVVAGLVGAVIDLHVHSDTGLPDDRQDLLEHDGVLA